MKEKFDYYEVHYSIITPTNNVIRVIKKIDTSFKLLKFLKKHPLYIKIDRIEKVKRIEYTAWKSRYKGWLKDRQK